MNEWIRVEAVLAQPTSRGKHQDTDSISNTGHLLAVFRLPLCNGEWPRVFMAHWVLRTQLTGPFKAVGNSRRRVCLCASSGCERFPAEMSGMTKCVVRSIPNDMFWFQCLVWER